MTVEELIDELKQYPLILPVVIYNGYEDLVINSISRQRDELAIYVDAYDDEPLGVGNE
jgi:hypothetical protein